MGAAMFAAHYNLITNSDSDNNSLQIDGKVTGVCSPEL